MVANFTVMAFASAGDKVRMPRRRPAEGRGCVLFSKRFQTTPSQSKQIQGKWKGIQGKNPWILLDSFVRFRTFQWVTAIPNKKLDRQVESNFREHHVGGSPAPHKGRFHGWGRDHARPALKIAGLSMLSRSTRPLHASSDLRTGQRYHDF
jgi:hypothetical protein